MDGNGYQQVAVATGDYPSWKRVPTDAHGVVDHQWSQQDPKCVEKLNPSDHIPPPSPLGREMESE